MQGIEITYMNIVYTFSLYISTVYVRCDIFDMVSKECAFDTIGKDIRKFWMRKF